MPESDRSVEVKEAVVRQTYRLSRFEKLVINEAIEFGLSHFCTGKVFQVPSVSRIIRDQRGKEPQEPTQDERNHARHNAMIQISKALVEERITKRNLYHINLRVDLVTRRCLREAEWPDLSHKKPLVDKVKEGFVLGKTTVGKLPLPEGTHMKGGELKNKKEEKEM